jgi:pimeloyl-ACP methyl ester carboxylesterase
MGGRLASALTTHGKSSTHIMNPYTRLPGTPEPMHHWNGDGVRLAGDSWGPPDGPPVLLQHGGGQTRHAWKGAGETLGAAGYFAVAFDARGHGDSDWAPDGVYGQDAMVRDLVCVVRALGGRRPVLVGASMGGGTSLVAVGEKHVDATALVLVDVAPNIELAGVKNIEAFMNQRPEGFDSLEEVAQAIGAYQPHRARTRNLDGLAKNVRLGADGKFHWHWDPRFRAGPRDLERRTRRLEACAANLDVPTLLVRGGLSDLLSEEGAQAFLKLCPRAEYVSVSGAAHMVAGDRNDIFVTSVIDFLRRAIPVSGGPTGQPPRTQPVRHPGGDLLDVP